MGKDNMSNQRGGGNYYCESHHRSSSTTPLSTTEDPVPYHHHQHKGENNNHNDDVYRKKRFSHGPPPRPDCYDGYGYVKLYVADIPRTLTEQEIRSLFEVYGNIVEIILLKERTGEQRECCFVKYTTTEEADRAISALNKQYMFPGGVLPIKVRYADGERDRLGEIQRNLGEQLFKLYVNGLNKQASELEVADIFSAYGLVEDIHIVRDELKQSRGFGFVKFSRRDMAIAAINALNGTYVMRGCDQPFAVRFADPKKPRVGESRNNLKRGSSGAGSYIQGPAVRPFCYHNDPMAGHMLPNMSHSLSLNTTTSFSQPEWVRGKPDTACSTSTASDLILPPSAYVHSTHVSAQMTDSVDCDWSEHTCPDGYKYYYNCVTSESRWEKPEEYSSFERQLLKQREEDHQQHQQHTSRKESCSPLTPQVLSVEGVPQMQQVQNQTHISHHELRQAPSDASEPDHVQVQVVTSPLVGPTRG